MYIDLTKDLSLRGDDYYDFKLGLLSVGLPAYREGPSKIKTQDTSSIKHYW
jgi:hypothetical protein